MMNKKRSLCDRREIAQRLLSMCFAPFALSRLFFLCAGFSPLCCRIFFIPIHTFSSSFSLIVFTFLIYHISSRLLFTYLFPFFAFLVYYFLLIRNVFESTYSATPLLSSCYIMQPTQTSKSSGARIRLRSNVSCTPMLDCHERIRYSFGCNASGLCSYIMAKGISFFLPLEFSTED